MNNSQGSSKDLFLRTNSQMDSFTGSHSQDWANSLSQDSRPISVPCTPSNIFGFPGSSENISQSVLPPNKWSQTNLGTPIYQNKDPRENQLFHKIWVGLTAVFKIVSDFPEKLKAHSNDSLQSSRKDIHSISEEFAKLFKARSDDLQSLFSDVQALKTHQTKNVDQFKQMCTMLDVLNKKLTESQELFESFQKSFQEDISKKNGIILRKLSTKIRDIQTWITDFQKVQNHGLSVKYDEILNSKKEILVAISDLNNKYDNLAIQLKDIHGMVHKLCKSGNSQETAISRPILRIPSQTQYLPSSCNVPLSKNTVKQSPIARVVPLHSKSEFLRSTTTISTCISQPAKRSVSNCYSAQRNKETPMKKTKVSSMWCVLTPEWNHYNTEAKPVIKETAVVKPSPGMQPKTNFYLRKSEITSSDSSFDDDYISNKQQQSCNQNRYFSQARPISRFSYPRTFLPH